MVFKETQVIMFAIVISNYTRTLKHNLNTESLDINYYVGENHQPGTNGSALQSHCRWCVVPLHPPNPKPQALNLTLVSLRGEDAACVLLSSRPFWRTAPLFLWLLFDAGTKKTKNLCVRFAQPLHNSLLSTSELSPLNQIVSSFLWKAKKRKKKRTKNKEI